jgi:hypothetical protein
VDPICLLFTAFPIGMWDCNISDGPNLRVKHVYASPSNSSLSPEVNDAERSLLNVSQDFGASELGYNWLGLYQ